MKILRIGIDVKNAKYAQDLMRGLAKQSSGLDIGILTRNRYYPYVDTQEFEQYDVVLTDRESVREYRPKYLLLEGKFKADCREEFRENDRIFSKYSPTSQLFKRVIEIFEENNGVCFQKKRDTKMRVWRFRAGTGGSGVSAAALTAGRLLACMREEKVLYISAGGSGSWKWYISETEKPLRPPSELTHLIRSEVRFSLDSYIRKDRYGLHILEYQGDLETLLTYLAENRLYDTAVVDFPEGECGFLFNKTFFVTDEKDKRRRFCENSAQQAGENDGECYLLRNRSYCSLTEGSSIHIIDDPESFTVRESGIEIALDKAFARGIEKVTGL